MKIHVLSPSILPFLIIAIAAISCKSAPEGPYGTWSISSKADDIYHELYIDQDNNFIEFDQETDEAIMTFAKHNPAEDSLMILIRNHPEQTSAFIKDFYSHKFGVDSLVVRQVDDETFPAGNIMRLMTWRSEAAERRAKWSQE